jgi:hypothetical protein
MPSSAVCEIVENRTASLSAVALNHSARPYTQETTYHNCGEAYFASDYRLGLKRPEID